VEPGGQGERGHLDRRVQPVLRVELGALEELVGLGQLDLQVAQPVRPDLRERRDLEVGPGGRVE
jgi:hypothetical protein